MRMARAGMLAVAGLALAACEPQPRNGPAAGANDTSVLGGRGESRSSTTLIELDGRLVSPPPAPREIMAQLAAADRSTTLALWVEDGRVLSSRHHPARGWDAPAPLEDITGDASDAQLAANARGSAMAVWRHTVGRIESLRYSRWEARRGWSEPDVIPGALPRAGETSGAAAPRLELDAEGNARAQWPSGFDAQEMQVSTYVPGEGWARPLDVPLAQAPAAPPARR